MNLFLFTIIFRLKVNVSDENYFKQIENLKQ